MKTTQNEKTKTNGKLFQRQEPGTKPTAERPVVEEQQVQDTGSAVPVEETAAAGLPVAVEAGGAVQAKSEVEIIEGMFPPEENFNYGDGRGAEFPGLDISKDTQQFISEDKDGNLNHYGKVRFVIYACSSPNACWLPKDHPRNPTGMDSKFPTCLSLDGISPQYPGLSENCDPSICEFNEFGSIKKIKPESTGTGKACKNMKVLIGAPIGFAKNRMDTIPPWDVKDIERVMTRDTDIFKIVLPPTSITPFQKYVTSELGQRRGVNMTLAVTDITLDKVTQPHTYSVAKFQYVGDIKKEMIELAKSHGMEILEKYKSGTTLIQKFLEGNVTFNREDVDSPGEPF